MKNIKIIFITYDGIVSQYCGIGAISQSFLKSYINVRNKLPFSSTLDIIGVKIKPNNFGYSERVFETTKTIIDKAEGHISFVSNGVSENAFGDFHNWDIVSKNAAKRVDEIIKSKYKNTKFIVICVDIPFLRVPSYSKFLNDENVTFVMKLHSTGNIHQGKGMSIDRLSFEVGAVKFYADKSRVIFANTSKFLGRNLKNFYGLNSKKTIDLQSGIVLSELIQVNNHQKIIEVELKKLGINTKKSLIFAMGRSEIYKGFHLLIDGCKKTKIKNYQLVILCPPYTKGNEVFESIKKQLSESNIDYVLLDKVDFLLPSLISQWRLTKIIAALSLKEPFGLIPCQVRVLARNIGPVILTSNRDGYKEQISDEKNGFTTSLNTLIIAKKIDKILNLNHKKIKSIKKKGFEKVVKDFDYEKNVYKFLSHLT